MKFSKDFWNTQTQNPNTQKIENLNPDLNLWVLLGACVWVTVVNNNNLNGYRDKYLHMISFGFKLRDLDLDL